MSEETVNRLLIYWKLCYNIIANNGFLGVKIVKIEELIADKNIEVFDSRNMPFEVDAMSHFAIADSLVNEAGRLEKAFVHFWPTDKTVFLGMQDTKLPYFSDALEVIKDSEYDFVVRNSGGLGVVADSGILNFSLIVPLDSEVPFSIDEGYEVMFAIIKKALGEDIDAVEIKQSYCPGDFDLSIDGRKIAGISQRRRAGGVAIMIYISIDGDQAVRSRLMKTFYEVGQQGEKTRWDFPEVDPEQMTTVSDANAHNITVEETIALIKDALRDYGATLTEGQFSQDILDDYKESYEGMIKRNKKMLGDAFPTKEAE